MYIDIDATEPTEQEMSDDEIVQAVLCGKSDEVGEEEGEEEEELDPPPPHHFMMHSKQWL